MTTAPDLPDLLLEEFAADPYSAYRVLREKAPLLWHEDTGSYAISRYEDVAHIPGDSRRCARTAA